MKKQILFNTILLICAVAITASCGKKETPMDMGTMTITLTTTPSPAVKNTPIAFMFMVMDNNMLTTVTSTSAEIIKGADVKTMDCMEMEMGKYGGTYTFTEAGTYEIHFKYTHEGTASDKDFTLVVQ